MARENKSFKEMTVAERRQVQVENIMDTWIPKTELGRKVRDGEIKDIAEILDSGKQILEPEIVDILLPHLEYDLINIGQSKGKFGGGKRSIWKTTQKKTKEGNKPKFSTFAVVGNRDGYVGIGHGKAKETVPAREKAIRKAKLNLIKIRRGSGSWQSEGGENNSIPVKVSGKVSSVKVELIPAPKGTGLIVQKEIKKILELAGIKDIYSRSYGQTKSAMNLVKALDVALKKLNQIKIQDKYIRSLGVIEGQIKQ